MATILEQITISPLERLPELLMADECNLEAYLEEIVESAPLNNEVRVNAHFRFIRCGHSGLPMIKNLVGAMMDYVTQYAIERCRHNRLDECMSSQGYKMAAPKMNRLNYEARKLFIERADRNGEGGEFLLYLLAERFLKIPQVLCKMPHKTNTEMHVHGTDGIHAKFDSESGKLAFYWCESKLYQSFNNAIDECFKSVAPFLCSEGAISSTGGNDIRLFRDNISKNIDDQELEDALLEYLDPEHTNYHNSEYRAICLVGFDEKNYPTEPNSEIAKNLKSILAKKIDDWKEKILGKLLEYNIHTFTIEIFCLPFPSVNDFRKEFSHILGGTS